MKFGFKSKEKKDKEKDVDAPKKEVTPNDFHNLIALNYIKEETKQRA